MKLRYYLRGLGIGMLVAALILILSGNTGGQMSDEAIKSRAAQLGMVEKDKSVLEDMKDKDTSVSADEEEAGGEPLEPEAAPESEEAGQPEDVLTPEEEDAQAMAESGAEADMEESKEEPVQSKEQALAEEIEQRADEVVERGKEVAENSVPVDIVTFVVQQGDTSISVARRAQEMGLVSSAADFDVFLCQNGYDKRIAIGSYEITVGAEEKEIADILTKSGRR